MPGDRKGPSNAQIAFAVFRVTIGLDIFLHGAMRFVTGVGAWEATTAKLFETTILPMALVHAFLYTLPVLEIIMGALTLIGLYTRPALIASAVMIMILVFGTGTRQDWNTVGLQMAYALYYFFLIAKLDDNWLAVDTRS